MCASDTALCGVLLSRLVVYVFFFEFFFLMIRRPPRSTLERSSAASEVYKRQIQADNASKLEEMRRTVDEKLHATLEQRLGESFKPVSYTHLRAHETVLDLVCRLLLEKTNQSKPTTVLISYLHHITHATPYH